MKVTRGKATFNKITLELETEEEARVLWHMLNNTGDLGKYWKYHNKTEKQRVDCVTLATALWRTFKSVYRPKDSM